MTKEITTWEPGGTQLKSCSKRMHFDSGGVRSSMYGKLPKEVQATKGYHGCLASLDLNGEATDPLNNALVPSTLVNEGCDGKMIPLKCTTWPLSLKNDTNETNKGIN